jgi:hypothetical protein
VDVENDQLIIGDNPHGLSGAAGVKRVDPSVLRDILDPNKPGGARVIAVDRATGTLRWITQVDSQPAAIITGSPVVFNGVVYQGVSSGEEALASSFSYPCCTFRGSVLGLDAKTGKMLWQTFTVPPNGGLPGGYSRGAVWQPPAIDPTRGSLFIGTGDNYTVPADVEACQIKNPKSQCTAADDYFDTALALDLKTGRVKWAKGLQIFDTFTGACLEPCFGTKLNMICAKERGSEYVKSGHTEAQMNGALKQVGAGWKAEDLAREVGVSKHTLYAWKAKYGGVDVSQAQEAKQLRDENTKLRKLVADLSLAKKLQSVIRNGWSSYC